MLTDLDNRLMDYRHVLDALVALGTLLAACITAWLAWQTRASVNASNCMAQAADDQLRISQEQTELTRQALRAGCG